MTRFYISLICLIILPAPLLAGHQEWRDGPHGKAWFVQKAYPIEIRLQPAEFDDTPYIQFSIENTFERTLCFAMTELGGFIGRTDFYSLIRPDGQEISWNLSTGHSEPPYQAFYVISPGYKLELQEELADGQALPAEILTTKLWAFGAYCDQLSGDNILHDHSNIQLLIEQFGGLEKAPFRYEGVVFQGGITIPANEHQGNSGRPPETPYKPLSLSLLKK